MTKILIVEDESSFSEALEFLLGKEGFSVVTAENGAEALRKFDQGGIDLVLLDLMIPEVSGTEVCRQIRAKSRVPIIMLTAKDSEVDKVVGLEIGADDYVTKPFSVEELVARIRAMVRRSLIANESKVDPEIRVGDLLLNEETYEVSRGGTEIDLTATEFELLRYMMRNAKRVLSKAQILDRVWSYDFGGRSSIVEIYISYLRKKIDSLGPNMIHTVRGVCYVIRPAE